MSSKPKFFCSRFEIHCDMMFFPNNSSSQKSNPGHVECSFSNRAAKLSRKSEVIFCSSPEHILEINKSRLSLEMFLWNHGVLFWQYRQKFPPKIDFFFLNDQEKKTSYKLFWKVSSKSSSEWVGSTFGTALKLFDRGPKFLCSKCELSYKNFFSRQLVFRKNFSGEIVCNLTSHPKNLFFLKLPVKL